MKNRFFIISFLLLFPLAAFSEIPGKYEMIIPHIPPPLHSLDKIRIYEVFAFDCIHCYNFHKESKPRLIKKFGDKIEIIPRPVGWRGHDPGRLYYIAEQQGKGEEVIMMIFQLVFDRGMGRSMFSRDRLQFVARRHKLDNEFKAKMDAPEIIEKMNQSARFAVESSIDATPTLVIEGILKPEREFKNMVKIINALLKEPVK